MVSSELTFPPAGLPMELFARGSGMSAAEKQAEHLPREERLKNALVLLQQALNVVDELEDCAVIGARLQGIIDELADRSTA